MNHMLGARRASMGSILVCQKKKAGKSSPPITTVEIVAGSRLEEKERDFESVIGELVELEAAR